MSESAEFEVPDHVGNPLWYLVKHYARSYGLRYTVAAVGTLIGQIPRRLPALVIGIALDAILLGTTSYTLPGIPNEIIPTTTEGQVWFTIVLLAGAHLLSSVFAWVSGRIGGTARYRTLHDIRVDTFDAVVNRNLTFFDDHQTGDVMSVLNNDVGNLNDFGENAFGGLRFFTQILVAFAFMLTLHPQLAVLVAIMPLLLAILSRWYMIRVEPRYEQVRQSVGRVNSRLEDSIDGIGTIKSFAREDRERDAVESVSREYRDTNWAAIRLRLIYTLSSWTVMSAVFTGLFVVGAYISLSPVPPLLGDSLTVGTLLTFLLYTKSFYGPVQQLLLTVLDSYENALASSKRIIALLKSDHDQPGPSQSRDIAIHDGYIEYDDISFSYADTDKQVLSNITFTADSGSLVGIVGPTGAGKSTITKLLFRFYEPETGTIRIDGTDIATVSKQSLRSQLGYVSQDPFLFYGTVRENIAYGSDSPDQTAIENAARAAGAHEFIVDLPSGYETQVGERGESLSGGQRQRIAIARAILRDPAILVLDEATSHVDNETERQIQRSISALSGERTTLAIAHRLSTVRNADQILVIDDGRIVNQGTHKALLADDGLYADLWRVQVGEINAVSESFLKAAAEEEESPETSLEGS